jgi:hypothetical protein
VFTVLLVRLRVKSSAMWRYFCLACILLGAQAYVIPLRKPLAKRFTTTVKFDRRRQLFEVAPGSYGVSTVGWDNFGRVPHDDWLFTNYRLTNPNILKRSFVEVVRDS